VVASCSMGSIWIENVTPDSIVAVRGAVFWDVLLRWLGTSFFGDKRFCAGTKWEKFCAKIRNLISLVLVVNFRIVSKAVSCRANQLSDTFNRDREKMGDISVGIAIRHHVERSTLAGGKSLLHNLTHAFAKNYVSDPILKTFIGWQNAEVITHILTVLVCGRCIIADELIARAAFGRIPPEHAADFICHAGHGVGRKLGSFFIIIRRKSLGQPHTGDLEDIFVGMRGIGKSMCHFVNQLFVVPHEIVFLCHSPVQFCHKISRPFVIRKIRRLTILNKHNKEKLPMVKCVG